MQLRNQTTEAEPLLDTMKSVLSKADVIQRHLDEYIRLNENLEEVRRKCEETFEGQMSNGTLHEWEDGNTQELIDTDDFELESAGEEWRTSIPDESSNHEFEDSIPELSWQPANQSEDWRTIESPKEEALTHEEAYKRLAGSKEKMRSIESNLPSLKMICRSTIQTLLNKMELIDNAILRKQVIWDLGEILNDLESDDSAIFTIAHRLHIKLAPLFLFLGAGERELSWYPPTLLDRSQMPGPPERPPLDTYIRSFDLHRDMAEVLHVERSSHEFPWNEEKFEELGRQLCSQGMIARMREVSEQDIEDYAHWLWLREGQLQGNKEQCFAEARRYLQAECHGAPVIGFVFYKLYGLSGGIVRLISLATHPAFRNRGVGGDLVNSAISELTKSDCSYLTVELRAIDHPAHEFFEQRGFQRIGIIPDRYPENEDETSILVRMKETEDNPAASEDRLSELCKTLSIIDHIAHVRRW